MQYMWKDIWMIENFPTNHTNDIICNGDKSVHKPDTSVSMP